LNQNTIVMDPMNKLTIAIVVSLVIIVFTIWKTKTSRNIPENNKVAIYVWSVLVPIVGLLLFLYRNNKDKDKPLPV
jgi:RsiW-degrading membrane proteinase PrsW (M82 family)